MVLGFTLDEIGFILDDIGFILDEITFDACPSPITLNREKKRRPMHKIKDSLSCSDIICDIF